MIQLRTSVSNYRALGLSLNNWTTEVSVSARPLVSLSSALAPSPLLLVSSSHMPNSQLPLPRHVRLGGAWLPIAFSTSSPHIQSPAKALGVGNTIDIWRRAWLVQLILRPMRWRAWVRF